MTGGLKVKLEWDTADAIMVAVLRDIMKNAKKDIKRKNCDPDDRVAQKMFIEAAKQVLDYCCVK